MSNIQKGESGTPLANVETVTSNTGGAVGPDGLGNIFVLGQRDVYGVGTPGANQVLFDGRRTWVNPGASPYVVLTTDRHISLDTSATTFTVQLPNTTDVGRVIAVKDRTGNAAVRNITITTVGGIVTIDGFTSCLIAENYGSKSFLWNGTSYEVIDDGFDVGPDGLNYAQVGIGPISMSINTCYVATVGAPCIFSLPAVSASGDVIEVIGQNVEFRIIQAAGQQIIMNGSASTLGAAGYIESQQVYSRVKIRCVTANTIWVAIPGGVSFGVV